MKNINKYIVGILFMMPILLIGCTKYLDQKPDKKLVVPSSTTDLQALIDNYTVINNTDPGSGEVSADNYYLTDADYAALSQDNYRRLYTWQKDYVMANSINDWFYSYRSIYYANTVIEDIPGVTTVSNQLTAHDINGQAHFIRAKAFFQLAYIFTSAYDKNSASADLGLPLRLSSDFNLPSSRSSVQATFDQIVTDLKIAIQQLPVSPVSVYRPSKPAAYALLARTYLYMRQYDQVALYADSCLQISKQLLDFNTITASATYPITRLNAEVVYESLIPVPQPISNTLAKIDPALYGSYNTNDLRKAVFFKDNGNGTFAFKGSYEGGGNLFSGISTAEVYLMRAEANARLNQVPQALTDLNTLLSKRWKSGTFVPVTASDQNDAINKILIERRKELLMRGLRWIDLKRLNKESANINLSRIINGQMYLLPANDLRYAIAIPEDVILLGGFTQNIR